MLIVGQRCFGAGHENQGQTTLYMYCTVNSYLDYSAVSELKLYGMYCTSHLSANTPTGQIAWCLSSEEPPSLSACLEKDRCWALPHFVWVFLPKALIKPRHSAGPVTPQALQVSQRIDGEVISLWIAWAAGEHPNI